MVRAPRVEGPGADRGVQPVDSLGLVRKLLALLTALTLVLVVACSKDQPDAATLIKDRQAVVIDVRTPAEFASGHVAGARNIDVQSPDFDAQVQALSSDSQYVVYCRSGNRSKQAKQRMEALGFTKVVDGGGFEQLKAAGVPTE